MNEAVISRAQISADAQMAAQFVAAGGVKPQCQFPEYARDQWEADFRRHLDALTAPADTEGGA